MNQPLKSALPVWGTTAVGVILVGVLSPPADYLRWLPIVLAGSMLLTFGIQLLVEPHVGFVNRLTVSVSGAIAVMLLATVVLGLVASAAG
ncbi:MAG: hypothetical protein H7248_06480 [Microbacteriaceae bacterium]|nr:hypothetical protein [Microbacteriaceae bacterium]